MDRTRGPLVRAQSRGAGSTEEAHRQQLTWLAWTRLAVVASVFLTTVLFDLLAEPERMGRVAATWLYGVLALAAALAVLDVAVLAIVSSAAGVAAIHFAGDLVVETALFYLLVPFLGYDGAVAFAMAMYFLTTLLACAYLNRLQGAAFATGAFLLQVAAHLLPRTTLGLELGIAAHPIAGAPLNEVARNIFLLMFTLYGTAWLLSARAERLEAVTGNLQSVTDDYEALQAFNEHVIQSMDTGLVTTDADGVVTSANAAARRLVAADQAPLRGRRLHDVLGWGDQRDSDLAPLRAGSPTRFGGESDIAGRRVALEVAASPLRDKDGRPLGLLFLLSDVTELRALEREIRLKDKMAAIGEMAAGIAHEIRNPLASISGSVQILGRQLSLDGDRQQLMSIVLGESRRLDKTIRDFLDFARPRELHHVRVDLRAVVLETLTLLRHSDEVKEAHRLVLAPGEAVEADVDADRLRQVVWNLCQNALKAMPDGGTLRITVAPAGDEVVLTVADTGIGMGPEALARAFQPLSGDFRSGSGLGLAIVYRIVKDHGGRVAIDSAPGAGTRVEVRLPARAGHQA